jgi:hypothetical protein
VCQNTCEVEAPIAMAYRTARAKPDRSYASVAGVGEEDDSTSVRNFALMLQVICSPTVDDVASVRG